jgi:hypothetical protein
MMETWAVVYGGITLVVTVVGILDWLARRKDRHARSAVLNGTAATCRTGRDAVPPTGSL